MHVAYVADCSCTSVYASPSDGAQGIGLHAQEALLAQGHFRIVRCPVPGLSRTWCEGLEAPKHHAGGSGRWLKYLATVTQSCQHILISSAALLGLELIQLSNPTPGQGTKNNV